MEFFDKLGKKASETYKGAAEKTGKIAKETKIKFAMNEAKGKINDLYTEIGKKMYENHIAEEKVEIEKDIEELYTQIDVLADEVEDYRKQILELKDKKQCEKCKSEIEVSMKFCPNCGEKQPEIPQENVGVDDNNDPDIEVEIVEEPANAEEDNKE